MITLLIVLLERKQPLLGKDISRAGSFRYVDIYFVWTNKADTSDTLSRKSRADKDVE